MDLEVLLSSSGNRLENYLKHNEAALCDENVRHTIIHQSEEADNYRKHRFPHGGVRLYVYDEIGLSKSRNRAIRKSCGEICLISDDDLYLLSGFNETIREAYERYPEADIITFQTQLKSGGLRKKYSEAVHWHNFRTIMKVTSYEISFRRDSIQREDLWLDERFGPSALFPSGEENIFLADALRSGLKLLYYPKPIVIHAEYSSGQEWSKLAMTRAKGAMLARMFGKKALALDILFAAKKYPSYKEIMGFTKALKLLWSGSRSYLKDYKQ